MSKRKAAPAPGPLHQLTVRIPRALNARLEAVAVVTGRTYRDIAQTAIEDYLNRLKLPADQARKLRALLDQE